MSEILKSSKKLLNNDPLLNSLKPITNIQDLITKDQEGSIYDSIPKPPSPPDSYDSLEYKPSVSFSQSVMTVPEKDILPIEKSQDFTPIPETEVSSKDLSPLEESLDKPLEESLDKPLEQSLDMPLEESLDMPLEESLDMPLEESLEQDSVEENSVSIVDGIPKMTTNPEEIIESTEVKNDNVAYNPPDLSMIGSRKFSIGGKKRYTIKKKRTTRKGQKNKHKKSNKKRGRNTRKH
jgi:hypothetical protein